MGSEPPPSKPQKHAVCIGLTNSGKTAALALVAGQSIDNLEPTEGFHIKDVELDACLLTVKEIGGIYISLLYCIIIFLFLYLQQIYSFRLY